MSKLINQIIPPGLEDMYRHAFGNPTYSGFTNFFAHDAYYSLYFTGRHVPFNQPSRQGIDNPNLTPDTQAQRAKLAYVANLFDTQRETVLFPPQYLGPRPKWWWAGYAYMADAFWFSNWTTNNLYTYHDLTRAPWLNGSNPRLHRYIDSASPDSNFDAWLTEHEPILTYDHDDALISETHLYIQHNCVGYLEINDIEFHLTNCTAAGVVEIHAIEGTPDIETFTWNSKPSLGPLIASIDIAARLPNSYFDPAGYVTFQFSLNLDHITQLDPEQPYGLVCSTRWVQMAAAPP